MKANWTSLPLLATVALLRASAVGCAPEEPLTPEDAVDPGGGKEDGWKQALPVLPRATNVLIIQVNRNLETDTTTDKVNDRHFLDFAMRLKKFYLKEYASLYSSRPAGEARYELRRRYLNGFYKTYYCAPGIYGCPNATSPGPGPVELEETTVDGVSATILKVYYAREIDAALDRFIAEGKRFDRLIIFTHGLPLGPNFGVVEASAGAPEHTCDGVASFEEENSRWAIPGYNYPDRSCAKSSDNQAYLNALGAKLHAITAEETMIYLGACNSATPPYFYSKYAVDNPGTPWDERQLASYFPGFVYANPLQVWACVSGRTVVGVGSYPRGEAELAKWITTNKKTGGGTNSAQNTAHESIQLEIGRSSQALFVAYPEEVRRAFDALPAEERSVLRCHAPEAENTEAENP